MGEGENGGAGRKFSGLAERQAMFCSYNWPSTILDRISQKSKHQAIQSLLILIKKRVLVHSINGEGVSKKWGGSVIQEKIMEVGIQITNVMSKYLIAASPILLLITLRTNNPKFPRCSRYLDTTAVLQNTQEVL